MKSKLLLGLTAALGSAALVVSALAQQQSDLPAHAPSADVQLPSLNDILQTPPRANGLFSTNPGGAGFLAGQPAHGAQWAQSEAGYLGQTISKLAHALVEAKSDSERDKLKNQLTETLEKVFDLRQKRHAKEIADLEAQVKKLKDLVQRRQENRRDIVAKRLDQIVSDSQGLGW
jgi:hypothetical protein